MKTVGIEHATLDACVEDAQSERVVLTRDGMPVAVVVGVAGMDEEQLQLGRSDRFWKLVAARRREDTVTRGELERMIDAREGN